MSLLPELPQTEEDPICRVCRSEATPAQPLFHPCKCSGSIKYVHQDCLSEWLTHSKKKYCELCNHPFSFTPIYDPTMPHSMPVLIFAKRVLRRCLLKTRFCLRVFLVGSVWVLFLPFITVWVWRFYFWTGKTLAYSITGRLKENDPFTETTLVDAFIPSNNETYQENSTLPLNTSTLPLNTTTTLQDYSQWTIYGIPVFNAASLFFSDCLEGQIITFAVVIGFVSAFLLREWIVRNTNQAALDDFIIDILPPEPLLPLLPPADEGLNAIDEEARRAPLDATVGPALLEPELREPVAGASKTTEMPESSKKGKERAADDDAGPSISEHPVNGRSASKRRFSTSDETQFSTRTRRRYTDIPWEDRVAELWSENMEYTDEPSEEEDGHELDENAADGEIEDRKMDKKSSNDSNDNDSEDGAQIRRVPLIFGRGISYRSSQSAASPTSEDQTLAPMNNDRPSHAANFEEHLIAKPSDENQEEGIEEAQDPEPNHQVENAHVNANDVNPGDPPPPANAMPDPAMVMADDDDMNGEDLDGFMEAIGMRGSLWTLLQNAVLMTLLIAVVIWGGIFMPYLIGKTALLFKPMDIFYLPLYVIYLPFDIIMFPLKILRAVTDPVLDLFLDYCSPYVWPVISTHFKIAASVVTGTVSTLSAWMPKGVSKFVEPLKDWVWGPISAPIATVTMGNDSFVNATLVNGSRLANTTADSNEGLQWQLFAEFALRWRDTGTPADKCACIVLGYTIVLLLGAFFLSSTRNEHGRTVGTALAQGLSTMLTGFKVLFFVIIELAIFPTACGVLLDLSMLPMFPEATVFTRWQFHLSAPFISTFLHWFIGTAFVYYFSVFISVCREIVRPGVLWWIKDPTDPDFQPIKEILERPARTQLKKIAVSAVIYSVIILFGFGSVLCVVKAVGRGVLPLRRGDNEPVWDFPADLVVANVLFPIFVRWANPKHVFRTIFTNWWRMMSRALRLTSFMFGDRYPEEEGSQVRRTAAAKLFFLNAPVMTLEEIGAARERRTREVNEKGGFAAMAADMGAESEQRSRSDAEEKPAVYFVPDGGLVRAPAFDRIPVVPGKTVLIRVKEDGITVVPCGVSESGRNTVADVTDVDTRGAIDILPNDVHPERGEEEGAAIEGQRPGVHEAGLETNTNTTLVYVPPNFKQRVFLFLFLMWFHGSLLGTSLTILPLLVGRGFFSRVFDRNVHDVYSFMVGVMFIVCFSIVAEAASHFGKKILHTEWWQAEWKQEAKKLGHIILRILTNAYVIVSIAGLVALEVGVIHELYIFNPLRIATGTTAPLDMRTAQFYLQSWGVGIFLFKIMYSIVFLARENYWSRTINEITAQGFTNLNASVATRKLIVPACVASVVAVTGPYAFTWLLTKAIDIQDPPFRDRLYHFSYPGVLCCVVAYLLQRQAVNQLEEWMQSVRDEEYLIGRQLNSLSPTGEPVPPERQVGGEGVA